MAKKSTSKKTSKAKKKNEQSRLMQSFIHYFPAWLFLGVIIILFIFSSTGESFSDLPNPFGGNGQENNVEEYRGIYNTDAPLATLFTDSIEYWSPSIYQWAKEANLNPNLVATVMQIESCGHPYIGSPAGAHGLFQIIPLYHFEDGDNQFDPNTNAKAGLNHMNDCLRWTTDVSPEPDVGLALVCYNGGPSMIYDRNLWVQESFNYYTWGTGIWGDASNGQSTSETLNGWLNAGGSILCDQATAAQELVDPLNRLD